jgi:hypothetical protein
LPSNRVLVIVLLVALSVSACDAAPAARSLRAESLSGDLAREEEVESDSPVLLRVTDDPDGMRTLADVARKSGGKTIGAYLVNQANLALANEGIGLTISFGDGETGRLTLWEQESAERILVGMPSLVKLFEEGVGPPYEPVNYRFEKVTEAGLGAGLRLEVDMGSYAGHVVTQVVTLYDIGRRVTYQLIGTGEGPTVFRYFDSREGARS